MYLLFVFLFRKDFLFLYVYWIGNLRSTFCCFCWSFFFFFVRFVHNSNAGVYLNLAFGLIVSVDCLVRIENGIQIDVFLTLDVLYVLRYFGNIHTNCRFLIRICVVSDYCHFPLVSPEFDGASLISSIFVMALPCCFLKQTKKQSGW